MILACILGSIGIDFVQAQSIVRYIYDDLGRLSKVIDPSGNVATYIYDPLGNILEIRHSVIEPLAIFGFTPSRGAPSDTVTIDGRGFSAVEVDNTVTFNGATAVVEDASAEQLTVIVPAGATTGPISVQVGANITTSDTNFIVLPGINSITPNYILAGTADRPIQITGAQLNGATFSFQPETIPSAISIDSATVGSSGTSASLVVSSNPDFTGSYVLIADTPTGQSSTVPKAGNTLRVINIIEGADDDNDGLSNAMEALLGTDPLDPDTDNDGFSDGDEFNAGSNLLDPDSIPLSLAIQIFSVRNDASPALSDGQATSAVVSVRNNAVENIQQGTVANDVISVRNQAAPDYFDGHITSPIITIGNGP